MAAMPKKYKDLKQKQKARISDLIYQELQHYRDETNSLSMTEETQLEIALRVHNRIGMNVLFADFYQAFCKMLPRKIERLESLGLPEHIMAREERKQRKAERGPIVKKKKRKKKQEAEVFHSDQNDQFFYIAGYTPGGAPYGVTWEEMGLEPWEELDS